MLKNYPVRNLYTSLEPDWVQYIQNSVTYLKPFMSNKHYNIAIFPQLLSAAMGGAWVILTQQYLLMKNAIVFSLGTGGSKWPVYSRVEWFLKKNLGTCHVVVHCSGTPNPKFYFDLLLFHLTHVLTRPQKTTKIPKKGKSAK